MYKDKVLSMIGLSKKAGKITSGAPLCEKAIKSGFSELIIIAEDASYNTKKAISDSCRHHSVSYIEYSNMHSLSNIIGAEGVRTVISVNDKGFADAILTKYNDLKIIGKGE